GFNPCSRGSASWASTLSVASMNWPMFQSLFSWIGLLGQVRAVVETGSVDIVSILVLVDRPPGREVAPLVSVCCLVSFLVLVDRPPGRPRGARPVRSGLYVSILVLVDRPPGLDLRGEGVGLRLDGFNPCSRGSASWAARQTQTFCRTRYTARTCD